MLAHVRRDRHGVSRPERYRLVAAFHSDDAAMNEDNIAAFQAIGRAHDMPSLESEAMGPIQAPGWADHKASPLGISDHEAVGFCLRAPPQCRDLLARGHGHGGDVGRRQFPRSGIDEVAVLKQN
jgi:hypothetical protein